MRTVMGIYKWRPSGGSARLRSGTGVVGESRMAEVRGRQSVSGGGGDATRTGGRTRRVSSAAPTVAVIGIVSAAPVPVVRGIIERSVRAQDGEPLLGLDLGLTVPEERPEDGGLLQQPPALGGGEPQGVDLAGPHRGPEPPENVAPASLPGA
jgi:hypothetical protein